MANQTDTKSWSVRRVNWDNASHRAAFVAMLAMYHADGMGAGKPLDPGHGEQVASDLAKSPHAACFVVWETTGGDRESGPLVEKPVGYAACFLGYSTFQAKPLLNLHDVAVVPERRGQGVGRCLLDGIADWATAHGCCKLTLEVLDRNAPAQALYRKLGFGPGADPMGFWTRAL